MLSRIPASLLPKRPSWRGRLLRGGCRLARLLAFCLSAFVSWRLYNAALGVLPYVGQNILLLALAGNVILGGVVYLVSLERDSWRRQAQNWYDGYCRVLTGSSGEWRDLS